MIIILLLSYLSIYFAVQLPILVKLLLTTAVSAEKYLLLLLPTNALYCIISKLERTVVYLQVQGLSHEKHVSALKFV